MSRAHAGRKVLLWALVLFLAAPPGLLAQGPPPPPPPPGGPPPPEAGAPAPPTFTKEELEQLVAPIALYPDALLAQVLMASTYPLQVVHAARWVKANPNVTGANLEAAMQQQPWDPSVKGLTAVPQVLEMMSDKLDWTQKLGDAFLAQEKQVMDSVQVLRAKAYAAGNLKTTQQQTVVVEPAPAPQTVVVQQAPPQIIQIQSPPQVVYVPTYNPAVIYGPWPYPAYPPYYYYPPGYVAGASLVSFGAGMAVGAAIWGNCNWHGSSVNVNINQYNNYNRTNISNTNWQHNTVNRQGVPYRDQATARQYGQGTRPGADSREAYRGRTEAGRQQIGQGGGSRQGAQGRSGGQGFGGGQAGASTREAGSRGGGLGSQAGGAGSARGASAYQGIGQGGQTRDSSNRGQASHQSMGQTRPTTTGASRGGSGGGSFGGGSGGRGGGGGAGRRP